MLKTLTLQDMEQKLTHNKSESLSKKLISDAIRARLRQTISVETVEGDPVIMTVAQGLANRLVDIALYEENAKSATTAAKIILEHTEGKPMVQSVDEKEELPNVVFRLHLDDYGTIKEKAALPDFVDTEDPPEDKVIVDFGDGSGAECDIEESEDE